MPLFSIVTPVYDTPADVLAAMLRLGPRARASATGSSAWSTTARPSRTSAQMLERAAARATRGSGSSAGRERRHRRRLQRRPGDGAGRVRRPARPRRRAPPRRAGAGRRGDRGRPRGRLPLHRRGQDRPRRPPLRPLLQARLVAGADADADVHLPPQRPAPLAGRGGRRLRPRVRGLPGLGPGPQGDRAGARRSCTSPRSSTTGARSRPRPPAAARRRSRGPSKPARGRCRRTASGSACRRGSSATRRRPGVYHLQPAAAARAAGQHRHPHRRPARAKSATRRSSWSSTACAASSRPRPTRTTRSSVVADADLDPARAGPSCAAIAGDRLRLVPYDGPFNFSAKINLGAVHSEGEHLLLLNDDMEVVDAGLDRADGDVLGACRRSAPSAAACSWRTGGSSTPASSSRTAATRATSTAASRATSRGYSNNVLVAQNYLAVTGACLMTTPRGLRRGRRPQHRLPGQLQRHGLLPEAAHRRPARRLRPRHASSTTSSPRAAPPRSRTGRRSSCSAAGSAHRHRPLDEPGTPPRPATDQRRRALAPRKSQKFHEEARQFFVSARISSQLKHYVRIMAVMVPREPREKWTDERLDDGFARLTGTSANFVAR